jgi:hypothetical protein
MFWKNKSLLVTPVDSPAHPGEERLSRSRPLVDSVEIVPIVESVIAAYVICKGFKTLCSAAEHVVVTRVK